jgi:uncharacterized protein YggL (DUF469 family)
MKKRLRKKRHLGEFQERGFEVRFLLAPATEDATVLDRFVDEYIAFVEGRHYMTGGGFGPPPHESGQYLARWRRWTDMTEADRAAVEQWFAAHPLVTSVTVGPLQSSWSRSAG